MKIAIASDHAGFEYKEEIKEHLISKDLQVEDFGTDSKDSTDYPDYAYNAAKSISDGANDRGIFICGSGTGVTMTANKVKGIRAANCFNTDMARLSREHNNALVLCIGQNVVDKDTALEMADTFLATEFEGGRHARRVDKITSLTGC
ncbi:MAG: ribose 5-phosphate isomerase B [Candidatus Kapaibacteriales bacterium]